MTSFIVMMLAGIFTITTIYYFLKEVKNEKKKHL